MLKQLFNIPRHQHFYIACSGGVDSMAVADFYLRGGKKFSLAYFHHGTPQADAMLDFVASWANKSNVELKVGYLRDWEPPPPESNNRLSPEEMWRVARYDWLSGIGVTSPIVTCHHLNDVVETWIFSCLHGNPKLIQPRLDMDGMIVYRPFLLNEKKELIDWCIKHNVDWLEDQSNKDVKYPRNRIRHNILPECLNINPGLMKVMKKKIINLSNDMNLGL